MDGRTRSLSDRVIRGIWISRPRGLFQLRESLYHPPLAAQPLPSSFALALHHLISPVPTSSLFVLPSRVALPASRAVGKVSRHSKGWSVYRVGDDNQNRRRGQRSQCAAAA
jgi:hypothetical protein